MSSLVLDESEVPVEMSSGPLDMHTGLDFGEIWCGSIALSGRWESLGVGESTIGKCMSEKRR